MDGRLSRPTPAPERGRLWKAGGMLAAFAFILIARNVVVNAGSMFDSRTFGQDFLPAYTAGELVRERRGDLLYDADAMRAREHDVIREAGLVTNLKADAYGPFLNPPFVAIPASWLAAMPYRRALLVWCAALAVFLGGAAAVLIRMLGPRAGWKTWGLIPLLLFTAFPAWQAAMHAQNTFFSLFVLATAAVLWRAGRALPAGVVAGLLLFKPQLGAIFSAALVVNQGRRALLGVAATGCVLLVVTAERLPGSFSDFLLKMPATLAALQARPAFHWHRHVTFLAFWRLLLQGHIGAAPNALARGLALACMAALGAALAVAVLRTRKDEDRIGMTIATVIASMPLLMPYYMDYDTTLLAVAAVLCAADAVKRGVDRRVLWAWVVAYSGMELNPGVAGSTRLIVGVPALAVLALTLIATSLRERVVDRSVALTERADESRAALAA